MNDTKYFNDHLINVMYRHNTIHTNTHKTIHTDKHRGNTDKTQCGFHETQSWKFAISEDSMHPVRRRHILNAKKQKTMP